MFNWHEQQTKIKFTPLALPVKLIDVEKDEDIVIKYKVNNLPKLILVDLNGEEIIRWKGITEPSEINKFLYENGYASKPIENADINMTYSMKYNVQQISYDYRTFLDIKETAWSFTKSAIITDKGTLNILDFMEVEQNGQVGIQMNVDGFIKLSDYHPSSPLNDYTHVKTVAVMRQPHNVWLWVYMFNEYDNPVAAFCGWDEIDGFAIYVKELKRKFGGGIPDVQFNKVHNQATNMKPVAEEKVTGVFLADGKKYNGWGFYRNEQFIPHGCGKKFYPDFYVYGNFKNGSLNGPAINRHDHYMYTMFFKENRGNGWGLCINGGYLVEFGYYEDSKLKQDLTDVVQWYYEGKMKNSGRTNENMLYMYTSKQTNEVSTLLIGYAPKKVSEDMTLACMGFRFFANGSVWVGTGNLTKMSGNYIHFKHDGLIEIGEFEDGILIEATSLQELIDMYFGTYRFSDDDLFGDLLNRAPKTSLQLERENVREQYRNIDEPKIGFNYFKGYFEEDDLPF